MTSAWLIYSLINAAGFPAQAWYAIEYPSRQICEAQAAAMRAEQTSAERKAKYEREQLSVKIQPRCSNEPPQFFIADGASQ